MSEAGRILIAAGGTGGHMFPAKAAAEALIARGWRVRLVTDARGAAHAHGFPGEGADAIAAASPFVKNPVRLISALGSLAKGYMAVRRIMGGFDPEIVTGFGGYPAFPALAAAKLTGLPLIVHEQNAVLGRVNRIFARDAAAVASGFERLDRLPAGARRVVTGNPVREAVLAAGKPYSKPSITGPLRLLVVGGSLGARILSEQVPQAVAALSESLRKRLDVTHQVRAEHLDQARAIYAQAGVTARCEPFFDDMGALYADAHLVISRAGASSVAEIAAMGRPSILIPLGIAMDDHQTANAAELADAGAAEVIAEPEFTADALRARLETLLADGDDLARRAKAALDRARPGAHERLADLIENARKA